MKSGFLAVDFGTSNCVAARISSDLKLDLVPLSGDKPHMPSSIFVEVSKSGVVAKDDQYIERLVNATLRDNNLRYQREIESAENQLKVFYDTFRPKARDPFKPPSAYKNKLRKYVNSEDLRSAIDHFKAGDLEREKKRLFSSINPIPSIDDIRYDLVTKFDLNAVESDIEFIKEDSFFKALLRDESEIFFGFDAIEKYSSNPLSGFFLRSPKAFLGAALPDSHKELFTRVITLLMKEIKKKAEQYFSNDFEGVVLGRPVNFLGVNQSNSNSQALDIMRMAAKRAGFLDVRFVIEPLAASIVATRTMFSVKAPAVVVDIGGGTTDVVVVEPSKDGEQSVQVLSSSGERVGGDDFDQAIAIRLFSSTLKHGVNELNSVVVDALSTRDIHAQGRFVQSGEKIVSCLRKSNLPIRNSYLFQVYRQQLQHAIILHSEKFKKDLTDGSSINSVVPFLEPNFDLSFDSLDFRNHCYRYLDQINVVIERALKDALLTDSKPMRVFLTGGMSNSGVLYQSLKEFFPAGSSFGRIPSFTSIVAGLAVVAHNIERYETNYPLQFVRGIPVER
jgi:hypothetical chaperone protein